PMQLYLALIALIVVQQVPQATAGQLQPPSVFPDAASTGVPSGTTLEKSGPLKISDEGTVVDSMEISGPIVVDAPNVTIRNSLIRSGSHYGIEGTPKARGLKVVNNELDGGGLMPGSYGISAPSDA